MDGDVSFGEKKGFWTEELLLLKTGVRSELDDEDTWWENLVLLG